AFEGGFGAAAGIAALESAQPGHEPHELSPGQVFVKRIDIGAITDEPPRSPVPGVDAANADAAERRLQLPRGQAKQRALAGSVGADQSGDPTGQFEGNLVQGEDGAVPLGSVLEEQERRAVWSRNFNNARGRPVCRHRGTQDGGGRFGHFHLSVVRYSIKSRTSRGDSDCSTDGIGEAAAARRSTSPSAIDSFFPSGYCKVIAFLSSLTTTPETVRPSASTRVTVPKPGAILALGVSSDSRKNSR